MSKVMTPYQAVADDCKNMNAEKATRILALALQAATYLEGKAQESVNNDGKVIAADIQAGENVDASDIFSSHKSKVKVSKTVKAITNTMLFGDVVLKWEQKQAAISTTAEAPKKELTLSK